MVAQFFRKKALQNCNKLTLKSPTSVNITIRNFRPFRLKFGVGGTIIALRSRFWVPSAGTETRRLLTKCVTCKKVTGHHYALPISPELPPFCYDTSTRPLSNVGIDFAGPLTVKDRSSTHVKVYICLFICPLPELSI